MKYPYTKPTLKVVELEIYNPLLSGSNTVGLYATIASYLDGIADDGYGWR
ncbi:MAG: hypothetical protein K5683_00605 [Prevotella sp.]|nr:hypothetical protein [Prevotella sp.]